MSPGTGRRLSQSRGSIPQVTLLELEIVPPQKRQEFLLERDGPVMIGLGRDLFFDGLDVGITHRESGVPSLPGEPTKIGNRLVDPSRRTAFDLPKEIGHRGFTTERDQEVNVVRHTSRGHERAILVADDAANVRVQSIGKIANEEWGTTLRTEDQMIMEASEGLRHGVSRGMNLGPSGARS